MTATATNETRIEADPNLPTIRIIRDFDAPVDHVFRAWVDRDLVFRWLGPADTTMTIDRWNATTGGSYRYSHAREGQEIASFYGSFHEVRPNERLVQTFTWEGMPDGVSLDTMTFEDLGDGRTRVTSLSLVDTLEVRDMIMSSGMDIEGIYERLDSVLADG
jgi:uncharacterized protein YndB with AHSA1/START domain